MNISLLDFIRCIDCEGQNFDVQAIEKSSSGGIVTGYLRCGECSSIFPIVNGVLICFKKSVLEAFLLPVELDVIRRYSIPVKLGKDRIDDFVRGQVRTHKNWSFQWLQMDTETFEEDWGKPFEDLEKFHYYDIPIKPDDYDGKVICEASCGFGRVIKILHKRPARYIAFDLSGAVYKAVKLFPDSIKLDILRADMFNPPFKKEVFDIVFSPRAIHHTGNMELALERMIPLIKKGGILAYSVYSHESNFLMWGIVEPFKRVVNKVIPRCVQLGIATALALVVKAVIGLVYVPLDKLNIRFLPLHKFFMLWSKFSFTTIRMNLYDLLHAPYAEYISSSQIKEWEKKFKLEPMEQRLLHDTVWGYAASRKEE